ncbi:hypothetical protein OROGR_007129 [Orobanche gracilis]
MMAAGGLLGKKRFYKYVVADKSKIQVLFLDVLALFNNISRGRICVLIMTRAVRDRILQDVNGNINDHLRNHIHLTNCIHLKNHMHKHSPIFADRALMRDLVVLQRSRSLRDPSASPHSWQSPSVVESLLKNVEKDELVSQRRVESPRMSESSKAASVSRSSESRHKSGFRQDGHLNTLSEQLKNVPDESDAALSSNHDNGTQIEKIAKESVVSARNRNNRAKRRRVRGTRITRPFIPKRDAEAPNEMSVASNSFTHAPKNGCGIPWNWSRIHDRGKSFLDLAGRSLSCGMSESMLRKGGSYIPEMPVMSQHSSSSSTKSKGHEALPLLPDVSNSQGSMDRAKSWFHDYSGELGIFADKLLKNETDSDLASECRSHNQHNLHKLRKHHNTERHQNLTQKYMPKTFRDLVGQSLVVQALSNAIAKNKVGLVYLFCGPHGTGKTSCARIFARALNCPSLEHPKPCGFCNSCTKARNVREIGPVSNIDIESVIELLGNAIVSKVQSQYRVLIFDECDTLSSDCWSALMKVVDRAPRRVVFILVCSSFDALPHVIISRCQKFFFPKLKDADIIYTLQWIATKEDLEIDKDALKLIASRSDGSLRDAEMTLEQLSLLGKRISLGLVQELVGLISDEKLVDLLDLALSADTVNTVKNLRDIMESGVEPLALMSQVATVITDILAGSYDFTKEASRRKFFRQHPLSKEDMEKLRQALKTLSEAEKQLRVSNDRMTWLTAALLQLVPDQQYMLPSSSTDTSFHHSPLVLKNDSSSREKPRKSNAGIPTSQAAISANVYYNEKLKGVIASNGNGHGGGGGVNSQQAYVASNGKNRINNDQSHGVFRKEIEEIWLRVLGNIPIDSLKEFMYREGKLVSVSYGAAPTVRLLFNSQITKSKAEKFRLHILQAFESVLRSPLTMEIRCEPRKDVGAGPHIMSPAPDMVPTTHSRNGMAITTSHDDDIRRLQNRDTSSSGINLGEIIEIQASPRQIRKDRGNIGKAKAPEGIISSQKISSLLGEGNQSLSIVRRKVSLAHVIKHAEGSSQHSGGWSKRKAVSIAEKLEQENLEIGIKIKEIALLESSTCNPSKELKQLSRLRFRTKKPQTWMKYVSCGRCLSGSDRSPRRRR